jgi:MFS family permease
MLNIVWETKILNKFKWLIISQSIALFGSGIVFPFYIIFIKQIGANFTEFGLAYGLFSLSSAFVHKYTGHLSDKLGRKSFLLANSWGIAILFLLFPLVNSMPQVYILQVMLGVFGAMHKTSEKALVADFTDGKDRGKQIGTYHSWISIFSALAVVVGGYLIDLFDIAIIFYIGSIFLFLSGLAILKISEKNISN